MTRSRGEKRGGMTVSREVGHRIARARLYAGLTQLQLAAKIGVVRQTIQEWENGHTSVSVDRLFQVAEALGADPATLLPAAAPIDGGRAEP